MEVVGLHHELIERKDERIAQGKRDDKLLSIKEESAKKLMGILPVALESIVAKVAPEGLDRAAAHTSREFFESLKENQLLDIMKHLDPEQQGIVLKILDRLAKEAEKNGEGEGSSDAPH